MLFGELIIVISDSKHGPIQHDFNAFWVPTVFDEEQRNSNNTSSD